jgi:large subunit ribosomal protein L9e
MFTLLSFTGGAATLCPQVKGPRGDLTRDFRHISMDLIHDEEGKTITCEVWYANKKAVACTNTVLSHITNMIIGVTKGYKYTMKFVYAHFPINAHLDEAKKYIELRNFLGEKYTRVVHMRAGVEIQRTANKDEIMLTGNDIGAVSESGAFRALVSTFDHFSNGAAYYKNRMTEFLPYRPTSCISCPSIISHFYSCSCAPVRAREEQGYP